MAPVHATPTPHQKGQRNSGGVQAKRDDRGPEVVDVQVVEEDDATMEGVGMGAAAGAVLAGGAAAVLGAPFVVAGAALGALAGGIAGGAMGSEVTRGVELDGVMDAPIDHKPHRPHLHLPHLGGGHHSSPLQQQQANSTSATGAGAGGTAAGGAGQTAEPAPAAPAAAPQQAHVPDAARGSPAHRIYDVGGEQQKA